MQLARAVRNRTSGVLYVLDEPSIGLHPANLEGLVGVMRDLVADGNSVVLVDHDPQVLRAADWIVELGPGAGAAGGRLVAQGPVAQIAKNPASRIGPFLRTPSRAQTAPPPSLPPSLPSFPGGPAQARPASPGAILLRTAAIHTVRPLSVSIPRGRLVGVTGVSGSGKTTLVLESLVPALQAAASGSPLPSHALSVDAPGVARAQLIDATPIGINVRSTVATYAGVHDELRKAYARTPAAKERGLKAGDFSYNTGSLRCPTCDGTGSVSLDVQFLPDVDVPCPDCRGSRYGREASAVVRVPRAAKGGAAPAALSLPALMSLSVDEALEACADLPLVRSRLRTLHDLGLGYLGLGEQTPGLSGGEAQRLKLASEMGRGQSDAVFVFDEPTIGLHPLDVQTLLGVFRRLVSAGATVVVIEHALDLVRACDWTLDMGPGGGASGGRLVVAGTPAQLAACPESVTGRYL